MLSAPWVDPQHSKVTIMQAAQYVPGPAYSLFNGLSRFAARGIMTTVSSSQAVLSTFGFGKPSDEEEQVIKNWSQGNSAEIEKLCGVSRKMQGALEVQTLEHIFSESTKGSSDEARHCARKIPPGSWGNADDYSVFVKDLAKLELSRREDRTDATTPVARLHVNAFFATVDSIVGEGGQKYVNKCWNGSEGEFTEAFDFDSKTITGSDHDGLVMSVEMWREVAACIHGTTGEQQN